MPLKHNQLTNNQKTAKPKKKVLFILLGIVLLAAITICIVLFVSVEPAMSDSEIVKQLNEMLDFPKEIIEGEETPPIIEHIEKHNGFSLLSVTTNGDETIATFKVFSPDLYTVTKEIDKNHQNLTKEEIEQLVMEKITKANNIEVEVALTIEERNGEPYPILTSEFVDAYYGGTYKLKEEYLLSLISEE